VKNNTYEELFFQALRIRLFEEKIIEIYPTDKIQSPVHLSIGQEAVAVGVCSQFAPEDMLFINYRGHAFYLAKGGPMQEMMAELYGRRGGLSGGKSGSMHLAAPQVNVMGASAVVASTISHAVGAALAGKILNQDRIFITTFGDGATEQGVYHESLNFASLHNLPVLFLCENNKLAVHSPLSERQSYALHQHAKSYGIKSYQISEGYDFMEISKVTADVISYIKKTGSPVLLEVMTCRYKEHVGPGEDLHIGYRDAAEVNHWKTLDPLCTDTKLIDKFSPVINKEILAAVAFAEASEFPDISNLLTDVF
jgi:TPP-dependent pyruvate/acetoin dehydrogenase alpha subunit